MTISELNKQIKSGRVLPVYFFYGEEQYLINKRIADIVEKIVTPGMEEFNYFIFDDKKIDVEKVMEAVEQYPQMSDKKVVLVKNSGFFNSQTSKEYKRLKEAFLDMPTDTCLIFTENNFDKKKVKNLDIINECGASVCFEYLPINKLEIWLEDKFNKQGKKIFPKELSYMVKVCGPSLGRLSIEFDKVLNCVGDRVKVTYEDIDSVVDKTAEYQIYELVNNIFENKSSLARRQLKFLLGNRDEVSPTSIISGINAKLYELLMCKHLKSIGASANEIGEYFLYKRPSFVVNKTINESNKFSERYLQTMMKKGLQYDCDIKSGKIAGDVAVELYLTELIITTKR